MKTVTTQKELEAERGKGRWVRVESGYFVAREGDKVEAYGSSQVTATGSSQVRATGSSQVTATGSSQVTAYDSSQVRAYGSSQVTATDSSQVRAYGSSQVTASKFVAITVTGKRVTVIEGTNIIKVPEIKSMRTWCSYYGINTHKGSILLFKGVDEEFRSQHMYAGKKTKYVPGTTVECLDFNERPSCGGGLHLSPRPHETLRYAPDAKRFVAVRVKVADCVLITDYGDIPDKCKVRSCEVLYEVDIDGNEISETEAAA